MSVAKLEITRRSPLAEGVPFGDVGPCQLLEGTAYFAVDPLNPNNRAVTDLDLAPRDAEGKVRFSSHFAMLQPVEPERGKHRILFDVVNRGRKTAITGFNSAPRFEDFTAPIHPGNGFLMRQGYTVVWCGWQADVPPTPGLIGMQAPVAMTPSGPLTGRTLLWFQFDQPTTIKRLADRYHLPNPPADPNDPDATLTVRDHPNHPARPISRDRWQFVRVEDASVEPDPCHIYMASGFEPGLIYELVYTTKVSRIVGLGFAAVRDIVSFLKYASAEEGNPCAGDIEYAYAHGRSQSGRFLRHYLYAGMNVDEQDRTALDGVIAHVAGGMRGEFNLRFGQPSKDVCFVIPELFPFTDTEQTDPVTGNSGSLLARLKERDKLPRVMFTNTSAEYWRGDAALIHTDLVAMRDAPEDSEHVRRYHYAGTQHGVGIFPPQQVRPADGVKGQLPFNSVDYSPLDRALLEAMDRWVTHGEPPPPSKHPSLDEGTAVESKAVLQKFQGLPGVEAAFEPTRAMRLDYGPELHLGRTVKLPADQGQEYPALVSDVNEERNEVAGIRLPDVTVPVATYTGWDPRHPEIGNPGLIIGITGGLAGWTLPLPRTRAEREASGDPRRSIEELYESRTEYLRLAREAAEALVKERYMLAEDVERVVEMAGQKYDYFTANESGKQGAS